MGNTTDALSVTIRCKACRAPDLEERFAVVLPEPDTPYPLHASALVCAKCGAFAATVALPHAQIHNGTTVLPYHDAGLHRTWLRCTKCGFNQVALAELPPARDPPGRFLWLEGHCAGCGRAFCTVLATLPVNDLTPLGQRWRKMIVQAASLEDAPPEEPDGP